MPDTEQPNDDDTQSPASREESGATASDSAKASRDFLVGLDANEWRSVQVTVTANLVTVFIIGAAIVFARSSQNDAGLATAVVLWIVLAAFTYLFPPLIARVRAPSIWRDMFLLRARDLHLTRIMVRLTGLFLALVLVGKAAGLGR